MKNQFALVCRTCAAGAVALFLMAANAGASVVFRGSIDPDFGLDIAGLSYTGEAFFNVADDCLNNPDQNGTHDPNDDSCGGITLISESITLTNSLTGAMQTLQFWPPDNTFPTDPIIAYVISGGTLGAVDTADIGPQLVTVDGLGYATGRPLWLNLFHQGDAFEDLVARGVLLTGTCDGACTEDGQRSNLATVTFTAVPEPGTIVLLIGAMTAGWIVRRRRSSGR